ncbi:MAG: MYXO-CTERM sorting domain-containing protein, partial [Polyangiales bacterium]
VVVENGVDVDGGVSITNDGGVAQADASGDVNGGCGCEMAGKTSTNPAWLLVSLLALVRRRRS